uniref:POTRA domain-containing protein n=1 Tax=Helminthocladia australis TaxID=260093 RepID=A0A1G4NTK9_9FLOR|nr:Hypothetical protein ORF_4 [Helminthocladia australis]SCW21944.1 Hypothetical protein ORF_4 [Helminthocladia australis]
MKKACDTILQNLLLFFLFAFYNILISTVLSLYNTNRSIQMSRSILAFHMPSMYQVKHNKNSIKSQEIFINGLDNLRLRKRIIKMLKIDNNSRKIISTKDLNILMNRIKSAGFFKDVRVDKYLNGTHQSIYFTLKPNPILQTVTIINYRNQLIALNHIRSIFIDQLAKPINFTSIQNKILCIKQWYINCGFTEIYIKIKYDQLNPTNINIEIVESIIQKINISIMAHDNSHQYINKRTLDSWLKEIFQIAPYKPLNILKMQNGLTYLQSRKMVQKCNYRINSNHSNIDLDIFITPLNRRSTYLFSKKTAINRYILESIQSFLDHSLNFLVLSQDFFISTLSEVSQNIVELYDYHNLYTSVYSSMSQYDFNVYLGMVRDLSNLFNHSLNQWYFSQLMLMSGDNFGFRQYLHYLGDCNATCLLNARFPTVGPCLYFKYEVPLFKILNSIKSHISFVLADSMSSHRYENRTEIEYHREKTSVHAKNSLMNVKSLSIQINNELINRLQISQHLNICQLNHKSFLLTNYLRTYRLSETNNYLYLGSLFKKKWIDNIYSCIKYKSSLSILFSINSNPVFYNDNFSIESVYLIPFNKYGHNLVNWTQKIVYSLKKTFQIQSHIFVTYVYSSHLMGEQKNSSIFDEFSKISNSIQYTEKHIDYSRNYKVEYYLPAKYLNIYLFLDYMHNHDCTYASAIFLQKCRKLLPTNSMDLHFKLNYGIGYKLITPIKQIPPLRIEYGYNINNSQYLHLKVER